jgi:hypothetical protein
VHCIEIETVTGSESHQEPCPAAPLCNSPGFTSYRFPCVEKLWNQTHVVVGTGRGRTSRGLTILCA